MSARMIVSIELDLARSQNWTRALIVPLLPGDESEPLGAFSVYGSTAGPGHFAESEWDKKVLVTLADYAVLAFQNAARQEALRASQEQHSVAETFAAVGDIASNLLHHLNNKVGTIPVRIQGIEDKCQDALVASPYLSHNLDEIERCATEAMESVRESLSHLRPIRLEPVFVAARIADAIQSTQLSSGIKIQVEKLDHLAGRHGWRTHTYPGLHQFARKRCRCHGWERDHHNQTVPSMRIGLKSPSAMMDPGLRLNCMTIFLN